jgi:hypothetical protein
MRMSSHPNPGTACVQPRALVVGDFVDETPTTIPWIGEVLAHRGELSTPMRGLELSRRTILLTGEDALKIGETVNLEMELDGTTIFVVATVDWTVRTGEVRVIRLRLGVTSPEGNDLIARAVGREAAPTKAEREPTEPIDFEAAATGIWGRVFVEQPTVARMPERPRPLVAA